MPRQVRQLQSWKDLKKTSDVRKFTLSELRILKRELTDPRRERHLQENPDDTTALPVKLAERVDERIAELRSAMLRAVTEEDIYQIALQLVDRAKGGDKDAAKVVFERVFGKPLTPVDVTGEVTSQYEADPEMTDMLNRIDKKLKESL